MTMPFAAFMLMWVVMMVAMMLPSFVPTVVRHATGLESAALTAVGYFAIWAAFGAVIYAAEIALMAADMRWPGFARAIPILRGCVLIAAGMVQLSPWKARHLQCCREGPRDKLGIRFGGECVLCCLPFMTVLVVLGMMSLPVIAGLAVAITAERLVREPAPIVRVAGVLTIAIGVFTLVK